MLNRDEKNILPILLCGFLSIILNCQKKEDPRLVKLPLKIVSVYPPADAKNVPSGEEIRIVFNKPLKVSSVNKKNIKFKPSLPGRFSYIRRKRMIKFIPAIGRIPDSYHTVIVTRNIQDKWGGGLYRTYRWSFRTKYH